MASVAPPRAYVGLDLIRLGAALLVALFHLGFQSWLQSPYMLTSVAPFASAGWVGVPIFFVISGFVIAFSAEQKSAGAFIRSRLLRLYPAAWICATITFLVAPSALGGYAGSLLLSPIGPWVSPVYWTLGVEVVFYALVALTLYVWGHERLVALGLGLGIYSSICWALRLLDGALGGPIDLGLLERQAGFLLLWNNGCLFAFGMMLWARWWVPATAFGLVGLVAVAADARGLGFGHVALAPAIWLAAALLIVAAVIWNDRLAALLPARPTRIAGLLTYPLYLVHAELGAALMRLVGGDWALAAGMVGVMAAALLILPVEELVRSGLRLAIVRSVPRGASASTLIAHEKSGRSGSG